MEETAPQSALTPIRLLVLGVVVVLTLVTAVLHYGEGSDVTIFILGGLSLAGLAWVISFATEAVGERFGPAITGVLQSTLGNLPELFVVLFALSAGEIVVAQTSILGSLFANALLVLGLTLAVGARRSSMGVMRFGRGLPNDTATLLLLTVFIIVLLGLSNQVGDRASRHQESISIIGAIVLLIVYGVWVTSYLRQGGDVEREPGDVQGALGFRTALVFLAVAGVGAAFVSEYFVGAIDGTAEELGLSKAFIGLVIVAIAGNAVEHVVSVVLAYKGKSELAVSVVKNSVSQIAAFLFPALVLISAFLDNSLTFVTQPIYAGALALTAIAVWQVTGDGEATEFEGYALMGLYVVLATIAFYE